MLFISNDLETGFINEGDRYDKRNFSIIRKLFVTPNEKNGRSKKKKEKFRTLHPFDEIFIRLNLEKFGDIEEIEMLLFGKPEAYVTFTKSSSAHAATADSDKMANKNMNPFHIVPADTWVQPIETTDEPMDEDEEPPIFVLNDDCFEQIFRYLDAPSLIAVSDVCKRFRTITKPLLRRVRELEFSEHEGFSLSKVRRYLKHVGNDIESLSFVFKSNRSGLFGIHFHSKIRWIAKLAQYTGPQLKKASFDHISGFERLMEKLRPMMKNLEELKIRNKRRINFCSRRDIRDLCPNLTDLNVNTWPFIYNKPFPTLQILKLSGPAHGADVEFFKHNSQLREIHFFEDCFHHIGHLVTHLPNIEKYTTAYPDPRTIEPLSRLENLTSLTLSHVQPHLITRIYETITNMVHLREFHLLNDSHPSFSTEEEREAAQVAFLRMVKALPNLEILLIRLLDIDSRTMYKFFREAPRLRMCGSIQFIFKKEFFIENRKFIVPKYAFERFYNC